MPSPYSPRQVISVLTSHDFQRVESSAGSHEKFVYEHQDIGKKRDVTVPLHDELASRTLDSIAKQAGVDDVQAFREWLDDSL
jgi:predicted RNA binding protein YcfA (HicA-like mRNA interferase family)